MVVYSSKDTHELDTKYYCECHTRFSGGFVSPRWLKPEDIEIQSKEIKESIDDHESICMRYPEFIMPELDSYHIEAMNAIQEQEKEDKDYNDIDNNNNNNNNDNNKDNNNNNNNNNEFFTISKTRSGTIPYKINSKIVNQYGYLSNTHDQYYLNAYTDEPPLTNKHTIPNTDTVQYSFLPQNKMETPVMNLPKGKEQSVSLSRNITLSHKHIKHYQGRISSIGAGIQTACDTSKQGDRKAFKAEPIYREKPIPLYDRSSLTRYIVPGSNYNTDIEFQSNKKEERDLSFERYLYSRRKR